jgi:putative transposase
MKRHRAEEVSAKLRQAEAGLAQGRGLAQVCQRLGVSEQTLYRWRNHYGGLKADEAKRLKELQAENARRKWLVAELALDKQMLQEVAQKSGDCRPAAAGGVPPAGALRRQRAARLPRAGAAALDATAAAEESHRGGRAAGGPDAGVGPAAPALRLPTDLVPAAGGLAGQPQADPPALAAARAESAPESFNGKVLKVRDELLNTEEFGSLREAKVLAKEWRREYNHIRPHSSLGYRTPAEFGAMVPRADSAVLRRPEEPPVRERNPPRQAARRDHGHSSSANRSAAPSGNSSPSSRRARSLAGSVATKRQPAGAKADARPGRPKTPDDIPELVLRLARGCLNAIHVL